MVIDYISNLPFGAIAGGLIGLALGSGFNEVSDAVNPEVPHLEVAQVAYLEFDGMGAVRQQIISTGSAPIPAEWTVQITRRDGGVDSELCVGSGFGNYHGEINTFLLDEWAGADCPDRLQEGDTAEVTWTYLNEFGLRVSIGTVLKI